MDTVLIAARAALIGIFVVAAVTKLADPPGSRRAMEDFAVPRGLVSAAAWALPLVELCAAVLLAPASTARVGGVQAVVLLLAFIGGIVAALRRGVAPECHCFGQLHSRPAGTETIVRNGGLAGLALFLVIAGPGPDFSDWLDGSSGDRIALVVVSLGAALLAYAHVSLRWTGAASNQAAGGEIPASIEPGEPMPDITVSVPHRPGKVTGMELVDGRQAVLVFTSATCGPCHTLLPELARWRQMLDGRLAIHVLASGNESENLRLAAESGLEIVLDRDGGAARAFGILGTPSAVEVDERGHLTTSPVAGGPAIEGLIRAALKRPSHTVSYLH